MIKLTSPRYSGLRLLLTPNAESINQVGGKQVVAQGKAIQFVNHTALVPDDWMPLIEKHPAFTGAGGHEKTIYLWSDVVGTGPNTSGPQIVQGAMGSAAKKAEAPHPDWDTMTPKEITTLIEEWSNERLEQSLYWELARRRRKAIMRALSDKLAPEPENPQPVIEEEKQAAVAKREKAISTAKDAEPIAQSFEAPVPEGQDV